MPLYYSKESVDLLQWPKPQSHSDEPIRLVCGDMHGNALKLLFILQKQGYIENLDEAMYLQFAKIILKPVTELDENDLKSFTELLGTLKFIDQGPVLSLGDLTGDRGPNDYFTLKLLACMKKSNIDFTILYANHDAYFIDAFMNDFNTIQDFGTTKQLQSLAHLNYLLKQKLISLEEVQHLTEAAYLPAVRLLSYSLDCKKNVITLFSHAAIDLNIIREVANRFGSGFEDDTISTLAKTIDRINEEFQWHLWAKTTPKLLDKFLIRLHCQDHSFLLSQSPVTWVIWNRNHDCLSQNALHPNHGYQINYIHGHNRKGKTKHNVICLDNNLGKFVYSESQLIECKHKGTYTSVYISGELAPTQQFEKPSPIKNPPLCPRQLERYDEKILSLDKQSYVFGYSGYDKESQQLRDLILCVKRSIALYKAGYIDQQKAKSLIKNTYDATIKLFEPQSNHKILANVLGLGAGVLGGWLLNYWVTNKAHFFFHPDADVTRKTKAVNPETSGLFKIK